MALAKKLEILLEKNPDIAVVQECSRKDIESVRKYGYESFWHGTIRYKGIGIIFRSPWRARLIAEPTNQWVVPFEFDGPEKFRLIAVWSCPPKKSPSTSEYVACVSDAIKAHSEWFEGGSVVVAGDFNSNAKWDKQTKGGHSSLVKTLESKGLVSFYHHHHNKQHGSEEEYTHHFLRQLTERFHIDYVFGPKSWTARVSSCVIGDPQIWNNHSDHCPIILELGPSN